MKTYEVCASYRTYVYATVIAENEDQAYEIARDMDGGTFEARQTARSVIIN